MDKTMKETILTMIECIEALQLLTDDIHKIQAQWARRLSLSYNEELRRMRNTPVMKAYYKLAKLPPHISREECILIANIFLPDLCTYTRKTLIEIIQSPHTHTR